MDIDISEALRYLGAAEADASLRADMAALAGILRGRIQPRWVWRAYPLAHGAELELPGSGLCLPGETARKMLSDCHHAVILVCTLGADFDAWVRREQARDLRRAVMLDALGSACVESACDAATEEIAARFPGMHLADRFSPGYGDLPLSLQPALLAAADASRRVGVSLTASMLMQPQKSVSALIGVADRPQMARVRGCTYCTLRANCTLRKAGTNCHVSS